jgi:hypothetical protein
LLSAADAIDERNLLVETQAIWASRELEAQAKAVEEGV